jgi:hypothetical protein
MLVPQLMNFPRSPTLPPHGNAMSASPMSIIVHLFVRPRRGAPLEDLGNVSLTPKLLRAALVEFDYRGRRGLGTVTLIDPHNWEKRPGVIPQVHVQLSEPPRPEGITRLRRSQ